MSMRILRLSLETPIWTPFLTNIIVHCCPISCQGKEKKILKKKLKTKIYWLLWEASGLGRALDSGEIYDFVSNKWIKIQGLHQILGWLFLVFYVMGRSMFTQTATSLLDMTERYKNRDQHKRFHTHLEFTVREYNPKFISCNSRLFMISVSWCGETIV